jgi:signal transduction histidine kinase
MTTDEIKALAGILREDARWVGKQYSSPIGDRIEKSADALEFLSDQLTAKTELATLYAASLRRSEDEADRLRRLLSEVAALKRYDPNANRGWNSSHVVLNPTKDLLERIDAAQSPTPKDNPT